MKASEYHYRPKSEYFGILATSSANMEYDPPQNDPNRKFPIYYTRASSIYMDIQGVAADRGSIQLQ
jgi:hypothetical protein